MTSIPEPGQVPPLVRNAMALAERLGFHRSCTPEVGRFLRVLAASVRDGVVAEIGTGCGVGAAWIASALPTGASFLSIELDEELAAAARLLFVARPNVRILTGDWHDLLSHGPFTLVFADAGQAKQEGAAELIDALAPGGMVLLDDLTSEDQWPPEWRGKPDPVRELWQDEPRLASTLLTVSPTMQIILATRLP